MGPAARGKPRSWGLALRAGRLRRILGRVHSICCCFTRGARGAVARQVPGTRVPPLPAGAGRHLIAVGGNRLSRGLTLEGLTISYFLRTAAMADTAVGVAEKECQKYGKHATLDQMRCPTTCISQFRCE